MAVLLATTYAPQVVLGVRHGNLRLLHQSETAGVPARVYTVEPTGDITYVHVRLGDQLLVASVPGLYRINADEPIRLEFDQDHLYLFDADTTSALKPTSQPAALVPA